MWLPINRRACEFMPVFARVQCGGRLYNINALLMGVGGSGVSKEWRPISKNKEEAELFILFA